MAGSRPPTESPVRPNNTGHPAEAAAFSLDVERLRRAFAIAPPRRCNGPVLPGAGNAPTVSGDGGQRRGHPAVNGTRASNRDTLAAARVDPRSWLRAGPTLSQPAQ